MFFINGDENRSQFQVTGQYFIYNSDFNNSNVSDVLDFQTLITDYRNVPKIAFK